MSVETMSLVITALGVLIAALGIIIHSVCFGSRGVLGNLPTNRVLRDSCRFRDHVSAPGTSIPEATSPRRAIDNIATSLLPRTWSRWRVIHTRVHRVGKPSGASWDAAGGISAGAALLNRIARVEGSSKATMVEFLRHYSNPKAGLEGLPKLLVRATTTPRTRDQPTARQAQVRLDAHQANKLAMAYRAGQATTELAERVGIQRTTVTAVLQRLGVELRQFGLSDEQVAEARRLYPEGWSLARPRTARQALAHPPPRRAREYPWSIPGGGHICER